MIVDREETTAADGRQLEEEFSYVNAKKGQAPESDERPHARESDTRRKAQLW